MPKSDIVLHQNKPQLKREANNNKSSKSKWLREYSRFCDNQLQKVTKIAVHLFAMSSKFSLEDIALNKHL